MHAARRANQVADSPLLLIKPSPEIGAQSCEKHEPICEMQEPEIEEPIFEVEEIEIEEPIFEIFEEVTNPETEEQNYCEMHEPIAEINNPIGEIEEPNPEWENPSAEIEEPTDEIEEHNPVWEQQHPAHWDDSDCAEWQEIINLLHEGQELKDWDESKFNF